MTSWPVAMTFFRNGMLNQRQVIVAGPIPAPFTSATTAS
jgi:hypothetical protein